MKLKDINVFFDKYGNIYFQHNGDVYIIDTDNKSNIVLIKFNIELKSLLVTKGKIINRKNKLSTKIKADEEEENDNFLPEDLYYNEIKNKTNEETIDEEKENSFVFCGDIDIIDYNNIINVNALYDTIIYNEKNEVIGTSKLENEQQLYRLRLIQQQHLELRFRGIGDTYEKIYILKPLNNILTTYQIKKC